MLMLHILCLTMVIYASATRCVTCHGVAPMTSGLGDVASPVASTPRRTAWVARSMSWPNAGPEPRWFDMTKSP